jgi:hypothetical protein
MLRVKSSSPMSIVYEVHKKSKKLATFADLQAASEYRVSVDGSYLVKVEYTLIKSVHKVS